VNLVDAVDSVVREGAVAVLAQAIEVDMVEVIEVGLEEVTEAVVVGVVVDLEEIAAEAIADEVDVVGEVENVVAHEAPEDVDEGRPEVVEVLAVDPKEVPALSSSPIATQACLLRREKSICLSRKTWFLVNLSMARNAS